LVVRSCRLVLSKAKQALRDLLSPDLFDEAKALIDEIVTLEKYEILSLAKEDKVENVLYERWQRYISSLRLYHYTSQINARMLLKEGYIPGRKPIGYQMIEEAWDIVETLNWHPFMSKMVGWGISSKEIYSAKRGLYVSVFKVYNKHMNTSEMVYYFTQQLREKITLMEAILLTSHNIDAYLRMIQDAEPHLDYDYWRAKHKTIFTKREQMKHIKLKKLLEDLEALVGRSKTVILWLFAKDVCRIDPRFGRDYSFVLSYKKFKKHCMIYSRAKGSDLHKLEAVAKMKPKELLVFLHFGNGELELDCVILPELFHIGVKHRLLVKMG
jgi:hypothetical protein